MRWARVNLNRAAGSFMEYMIVFGIISAVLWGMNIYVKRGLQGKVKDLTDVFMGKGQETDISPTAAITSKADSLYGSTVDTQLFLGGGSRVSGSEQIDYEAKSTVTDWDVPDAPGNLVPASEGYVNPGPPVTEQPPEEGSSEGASGG
ncbi:MAG: hypothetical protein PHC71_02440 [Candidatus Omnitrophica bacterium]|nr:hypothetical protein [Candidatus Omnitrophota bacterium]